MFSSRIMIAAGLALSAFAMPAVAVDGVVLIDQNRAMVGNVTPGDLPGFPVSINLPGSYRLSGNLTVPAGIDGIQIGADDITLDLNGFRLVTAGGGATAILDSGNHSRLAVSNGTLSGFGNGLLALSSRHSTVRDVRSTNISSVSIAVGQYASLTNNTAQGLVQAECPSLLRENLTEGFITVVITSGEQCVRWNNRALNFTGAVTQ